MELPKMEHVEHLTHEVTTGFGTDRTKKYRNFFVRTYLDKEHLYSLVSLCSNYAFILHDKEDSEPHFHCVMHFENPRTIISIAKKVQVLTDHLANSTNNPKQKTHLQICAEPKTAFMYLTHTDPSSKAKGKLIYSETEVIGEGISFFKNEDVVDYSTTDILDAINSGVSYRVMAQRFGKSFVCNFGKYKDYATMLNEEENPRGSSRAIEFTFRDYLNGNCSASVFLADVLDTIAYDLYGSQYQDAEKVAKCKEFEEFLLAFEDIFNERRMFYKGLDKVADLKLYGFDNVAISKSGGVSDAVKCERWTDFG